MLCPSCPSHIRLKFAKTVLFLLRSRTVNMAKRVCRDCPIPNCGAKYLVKLSNHLTDVHELDYINRRKWLQEAKLQPKVGVMIYREKRTEPGIKTFNKWNTSIRAGRGKGYNRPSVINTKRSKEITKISTKKSKEITEISTKRCWTVNSIKHCKTTADSVPEWLTLYGDDEGPNTEKRA